MRAVAVFSPTTARHRRRIWSSRRWTAYFRRNAANQLHIRWERGAALSRQERDALAASVQVFQQGEAQEGRHFFRVAQEYAEQSGDADYVPAHRHFMAEERRHGRDLARFLELAGVPCLVKQSWLARAFCWCGSRGRLEMTLRIILMSEIIAQVYYAAVRQATGSPVLRRLCAQILRDEKAHVRFQCERLALIRSRRSRWRLLLDHLVDAFLFVGAALACWCGHRRALRAGARTFSVYWRDAFRKAAVARKQKDPRNYLWDRE